MSADCPRSRIALILLAVVGVAACVPPKTARASLMGVVPEGWVLRPDGAYLTPAERDRGGVVVVAFFSSWCPVSPAVLTTLQNLSTPRNEAHGLHVVALDEGDSPEEMTAFLAKHRVRIPVERDTNARIWNQFGLVTVPTVLVMDLDGTVRFTQEGYHGEEDGVAIDGEVLKLVSQDDVFADPPSEARRPTTPVEPRATSPAVVADCGAPDCESEPDAGPEADGPPTENPDL